MNKFEINLDPISDKSLCTMLANIIMKYGIESAEVDLFWLRIKNKNAFKSEQILESYFILYEFGFNTFWNL